MEQREIALKREEAGALLEHKSCEPPVEVGLEEGLVGGRQQMRVLRCMVAGGGLMLRRVQQPQDRRP